MQVESCRLKQTEVNRSSYSQDQRLKKKALELYFYKLSIESVSLKTHQLGKKIVQETPKPAQRAKKLV